MARRPSCSSRVMLQERSVGDSRRCATMSSASSFLVSQVLDEVEHDDDVIRFAGRSPQHHESLPVRRHVELAIEPVHVIRLDREQALRVSHLHRRGRRHRHRHQVALGVDVEELQLPAAFRRVPHGIRPAVGGDRDRSLRDPDPSPRSSWQRWDEERYRRPAGSRRCLRSRGTGRPSAESTSVRRATMRALRWDAPRRRPAAPDDVTRRSAPRG